MKLRIKGNSLRLRLTQPEVQQFDRTGRVAEEIRFGPDRRIVYVLETSEQAETLRARFDGERVVVQLSSARAASWAEGERVGFEGTQPLPDGDALNLLVEKDFQCLHKGAEAQDADAFPHPQSPSES